MQPARPQIRLSLLQLKGLLSFGPAQNDVPLDRLNVLIGPNASGKSNVIDALSLLAALPSDLTRPIREGGGMSEWLWKGQPGDDLPSGVAGIEVMISRPNAPELRHVLVFQAEDRHVHISREHIENAEKLHGKHKPYLYYEMRDEIATFNVRESGSTQYRPRRLKKEHLRLDQSVLAQRNDPEMYPELTRIRDFYADFRFYREWTFGRGAAVRRPQGTDSPARWLDASCENLAMVLSTLQRWGQVWDALEDRLRRFHPRYEKLFLETIGNTIQIFIREKGLSTAVPATRISDGTLRYLALLAILLHPEPPPVICLEEPELGLHPDLIGDLAELLQDASTRSQIFVSTHSDHLVSALRPEDVIVCEREPLGTTLKRLDAGTLEWWLKRYTLGALWRSGELGGTRW